ncbi:MAG: hypothetical protein R2807_03360 [Chitinophagales bacterium]
MLAYFLLTLLIEIPIYFYFNRDKIGYSLLILFLANCLTWPLLNILYHTSSIHILLLEIGVAITEGFILFLFLNQPIDKAMLISFLQNALSAFIGIWINNIQL